MWLWRLIVAYQCRCESVTSVYVMVCSGLHACLYLCRCESVTSAYLMVRSGLCPYVYICCHHMTVIFRAAGIVRDQLHAVLTPTTRGIRAALDSDGKSFTAVHLLESVSKKCCCHWQTLMQLCYVWCDLAIRVKLRVTERHLKWYHWVQWMLSSCWFYVNFTCTRYSLYDIP